MDSGEVAARFAEIDDIIEQMDGRLRTIAAQNAKLADMVEVLGGSVSQSIEYVSAHAADPNAHRAD